MLVFDMLLFEVCWNGEGRGRDTYTKQDSAADRQFTPHKPGVKKAVKSKKPAKKKAAKSVDKNINESKESR
jgi:hypothetical protein